MARATTGRRQRDGMTGSGRRYRGFGEPTGRLRRGELGAGLAIAAALDEGKRAKSGESDASPAVSADAVLTAGEALQRGPGLSGQISPAVHQLDLDLFMLRF